MSARAVKCPTCLEEADILSTLPLVKMRLAKLSCGHQVTYKPGQGKMSQAVEEEQKMAGEKGNCALCGQEYVTYAIGSLGKICGHCKSIHSIHTQAEATDALEFKAGKTQAQAQTAVVKVEEKPDPVKLMKLARTLVEYGRFAEDIDKPMEVPTTYVIAKSGLFEVKDTGVAKVITRAKEVVGVPTDLNEGIQLNIPMLSFEQLRQVVVFFRAVCKKAGRPSEAYIQIWWNNIEQSYHFHVPKQNVSGASVRHQGEFDKDCAVDEKTGQAIWMHVADIHSHGSMNAFWSGTDNADEMKAPEGRLFGVIGKVESATPEWKWRIRLGGGFVDLDIMSIFDFKDAEQEKVPFTITLKGLMAAWKEASNGAVKLICPVDPFAGGEDCPKEWLDAVETHTVGVYSGWQGRHLHQSPLSSQAPMILFINDGGKLREYEDLNGQSLRPTGFAVELKSEKAS